ncbi:strawberry notch C-terminal domain-containing protein [Picosynechococcus sp. PCC 7117]|uniref:strawberry notch C-terminal domain-containing protein n=1 Tax=Picosynechococcus sp. PCC 7117 TaxID=195498 RepID=UPI001E53F7B8|nr:strawberry notch C-terminal domain-containing protein [Picosynechococcus sp. PCC 7117]
MTNLWQRGGKFDSITAARKAIQAELGIAIEPGSQTAKIIDEVLELSLVTAAREIASEKKPLEAFDLLVDLYDRQPRLGVRSSTSVRQQAYSTALPIAYLASTLAGINPTAKIYEPTAGNGALLLGAAPENCTVNELNPDRANQLRSQGFTVTEQDATAYLPNQFHDVVIMNPPFGRVKGKRFRLAGEMGTTSQIDQAIALQALQAMKNDGRAVLILGGKPETTTSERAEAYNSLETRRFFYVLQQQYNVIDHFTISGDLYRKQGAGWAIDIIQIAGRGQSQRPLPAVEPPRIYTSFNQLRGFLHDYLQRNPIAELQRIPNHRPRLDPKNRGGSGVIYGTNSSEPKHSRLSDVPRIDESAGRVDVPPMAGTDRTVEELTGGIRGDITATQSVFDGSFALSERGHRRNRRLVDELGGESGGIQFDMAELVADNQLGNRVSRLPNGIKAGSQSDGTARRSDNIAISVGTQNSFPINEETTMSEEFNIPYQPRSQGRSPQTLIPTNMAVAAQKALDVFEAVHGNIDDFVCQRLGYPSKSVMFEVLYAEQIDSLALAFVQKDQGKIFLNGDQTGNGKGRFGAANIIDAQRQGHIPVFVTQKPNLYAAMLEDLADIGQGGMTPFMTNNNEKLILKNGTVLTTGNKASQEAEMFQIAQRLHLGNYGVVFTTYNQLQTVNNQEPYRREFLRAIAHRSVFIFDEAHEAGGGQSETWKTGQAPNRAEFVRELVDLSAGAMFMSATATKNPAVMDLYARRTDAIHAVDSMYRLENTLKAGGIPLQQMMATQFVRAGNMLRRERSFDNISFDAKTVPVDQDVADNISAVMRAIDRFDATKAKAMKELRKEVRAEAKSLSEDNSIGQASVQSVNFTSLMHNAIEQGLLSQKAEATVQEAIAALERGEKPLIALSNTMDSFIGSYAKDQGIEAGEAIEITFGDVLNRYLERSRDVIITDYLGKRTRMPMTADQLGEEAIAAFEEAKEILANADFTKIPLSSIDYMKYRLAQEGYRVDEITGRSSILQYNDSGMTYVLRSAKDTSPQAKIDIVNRFNSGQLDVVILNRSGATGISLHASEKFTDQRPRHMIVAQAERDINQMMQMLGRANRFGQVIEPKFTLVMADVPAEKRLGAILAKKMASLNANTTGGRDSALSVGNVIDFMNTAGEEVITELLEENPELDAMLSYPTRGSLDGDTALIQRVTGRIPLLPLSDQEELYGIIETETEALIKQKEAMGENILAADKLDLDARTVAMMEVVPADANVVSEFTGTVVLEVVDAKVINKPPSQLQVMNLVRENLEQPKVKSIEENDLGAIQAIAQQEGQVKLQTLQTAMTAYRERVLSQLRSAATLEKTQEKLDQQWDAVQKIIEQFPVGEPVQFFSLGLEGVKISSGVVIDITQKSRMIGSPSAPTNWTMQIISLEGKRLSLPFSKINTGRASSITLNPADSDRNIYGEFDRLQQAQRTEMQVFTGNLLKAYEKFPKGKFVNFTDQQGQTRQGLLMHQDFDIVEQLQQQPVSFENPEQVSLFLTEWSHNRGVVESLELDLAIKANGNARLTGKPPEYYVVQVPEATSRGGKYFLNEALLQAAQEEFYSVGGRMEMRVQPKDLEAVVQVLMEALKVKLAVHDPSYKELLREHLGQSLPTLQQMVTTPVQPEATEQLQIFNAPPAAIATPPLPKSVEPIPMTTIAEYTAPVQSSRAKTQGILSSEKQGSKAAKHIAQLLHKSGFAALVLAGESFHQRFEQDGYLPFVIERHGEQFYLSHYAELNGDHYIDAEMVFQIGQRGNLSLLETASYNPLTGGELRNKDYRFAELFSGNLLAQGWAEVMQASRQDFVPGREEEIVVSEPTKTPEKIAYPQEQPALKSDPPLQNSAPSSPRDLVVSPENWGTVARAIAKSPAYLQRIQEVTTKPLQEKAVTAMENDFAAFQQSVTALRQWYAHARCIDKAANYLQGIQAIAEQFKAGQPLSEAIHCAMQEDRRVATFEQLATDLDRQHPATFLQTVAQRGLQKGLQVQELAATLLQGDPALRDIHKIQPQSTQAYLQKILATAEQLFTREQSQPMPAKVSSEQHHHQKL